MKKLFCSILIFISSISVVAEQLDSPAIKSSLAVKSLLLDIVNVENKYLIAVGERGHILRGEDTNNFIQVEAPTRSTLTAVTFANDKDGWAVGHNGVILHTADGGLSWKVQQYLPNLQKPLLDVAFKNSLEGIALGAYGLFFQTSDGGETWVQKFHLSLLSADDLDYLDELRAEDEQAYLEERANILPHFNGITFDNESAYLVGEVGLIGKSEDAGKTWKRLDDVYQGSFYDLTKTDTGTLFAVGLRGNIYSSENEGRSWVQSKFSSLNTTLLNSVISHKNSVYIFGNNGVQLTSYDDGDTFTSYKQADGKAIIAGTLFKEQLVVATEVGVKVLKVVN